MTNDAEFRQDADDALFLDPVDPTLLDGHEDFLNIVIGQINKHPCLKTLRTNAITQVKDSYYQHLSKLASALEGEQNAKTQFGLDRLLSYQSGLEIGQLTHEYFQEVLKLTNKKLIVITIDDVDMSLCHGFKVLEVVRKHICSPLVMPIVSGDLQLYQELVGNEFNQQLLGKQRSVKDKVAQREQARSLADEYLRKIFPIHLRLSVPNIEAYVSQNLGTTIKITHDNKELGNLFGIHQLLLIILNGRVNGEENSSVQYIPHTARELIQWLSAIKTFLLAAFTEVDRKLLFPDVKSDRTTIKKSIFNWWLQQSKLATNRAFNPNELYQQLANYFDHGQYSNLHELCSSLANINENIEWINLTDITYLNPIKQLMLKNSKPIYRNNENHTLYYNLGFERQRTQLPTSLLEKNLPFISALPAIEPIDELLFFRKNFIPNTNSESIDNDFLLFLYKIFTHDDYYTSYQSTNLVFFGRFFELITTSLLHDIDINWLKELLGRPPYYSILSFSSTKNFDLSNDIENQEIEVGLQTKELDDFLKRLSDEINSFRRANKLDEIFSDLTLT